MSQILLHKFQHYFEIIWHTFYNYIHFIFVKKFSIIEIFYQNL